MARDLCQIGIAEPLPASSKDLLAHQVEVGLPLVELGGQGPSLSDILVHRYVPAEADDGLPGNEGTFSLCTFWLVEALTRAGRVDEARLIFEKSTEQGLSVMRVTVWETPTSWCTYTG